MTRLRVRLLLVCWILGVLAFDALAQPPDTVWTRSMTGMKECWGLARGADGNLWAAGFVQSTPSRQSAVICKFDPQGAALDSFVVSDTVSHALYCVASTPDSGCVAAGTSLTHSGPRLLVTKVNSSGAGWAITFTQLTAQVGNAVICGSDGNYIVAGRGTGAGGGVQPCLVKITPGGSVIWSKRFGAVGADHVNSLVEASDHGLVLGGSSSSAGVGSFLVIWTTSGGDSLSEMTYSLGTDGGANCIRQAWDDGFVLCGWYNGGSGNMASVLKINSTGSLLWSQHYNYGPGNESAVYNMEPQPDNGFVLAGYARLLSGAPTCGILLCVNSVGDSLWTRTVNSPLDNGLRAVSLALDNTILAAGHRLLNSSTGYGDILRLSPASGVRGIIRNENQVPLRGATVSAAGLPYTAISDPQGIYTLLLAAGTYDLVVHDPCAGRDTLRNVSVYNDSINAADFSINMTGGVVEQTSINPVVHNHIPGFDTLRLSNTGSGIVDFSIECQTTDPPTPWLSVSPASGSIPPHSNLGILVRVLADTTDDGIYDFYGLLTVHMNTCPDSLTPVLVIASVLEADSSFILHPSFFTLSAFPNPFNPTTELRFDLPKAGHVELAVFDIQGRKVETLTGKVYAAGSYRFFFDGSALPSGVYFARLATSGIVRTQKLLLLK